MNPASNPLVGPKLKVDRAKRHLGDFEVALKAFFDDQPYELIAEDDPDAGEHVYRVRIHKCVPAEFSIMIGDVVHNLRSALDQLVCGLVRFNRKQVSSGNGFPIMGSVKRFEEACVGKLKNVPAKANRFIRRLKPYQGGNRLLWILSELDNMDKHNAIVPVAAGRAQGMAQIGMPDMFLSPEGNICIGGGPPGSIPMGFDQGFMIPDGLRPVEVLYDNCEVYRSKLGPSGFVENVQATIEITFGKTHVTDNEIVVALLKELINLVDGIVQIVERRVL